MLQENTTRDGRFVKYGREITERTAGQRNWSATDGRNYEMTRDSPYLQPSLRLIGLFKLYAQIFSTYHVCFSS